MKSALLHYWLTNVRGGEKVLAAIARILPGADIFTHAYVPAKMGGLFASHRVQETFIARLPFAHRRVQIYAPLMTAASRALNLDAYDLIVSSESGPVKYIRRRPGQRHICYCHTPMRYLWDCWDEYYRSASLAGKAAMRLFTPAMRKEDLRSAETVDEFVANSAFVAERIRRIYNREAVVIHPPVDIDFFSQCPACPAPSAGEYYLFAGANVKYKRLDLAEAACRLLGRRLVVAGGGKTSGEDLRALYAGARALIFPGVEDFGIVPVEAQAAGTPVIAFARGGALETVRDGRSGLFFQEPTPSALAAAIEEFEGRSWSRDECRASAARFAPDIFERRFRDLLGHNSATFD